MLIYGRLEYKEGRYSSPSYVECSLVCRKQTLVVGPSASQNVDVDPISGTSNVLLRPTCFAIQKKTSVWEPVRLRNWHFVFFLYCFHRTFSLGILYLASCK
jgi:hypothetical protein